MKSTLPIVYFFVFMFVISMSGCSKSSETPFYKPSEDPLSGLPEAPSVGEDLAKKVGVERIIYHVGPVDLPAGQTAEAMLDKPLAMRFQTDKAIWVTGFVPRVVDAGGKELPAGLLHQALVFNMHEENPLCAGAPNPFAMATSLMTEVELPQGYGYPVLPADPIEARATLKNLTDESYSGVYFEIALITRPMSDLANMKDVRPIYLELDPCSHSPMEVEPRAFVQKSATYQVPDNGEIVVAHGALQDFGAQVWLITGKDVMPFWKAEGLQDEAHHLTALTDNPFIDAEGVAFKAGDHITVGVSYDNASDAWLKGATAGAMVYLAPRE